MVLAACVLLLSVPLVGGDLRRFAGLVLRSAWLLPLALGLQALVFVVLEDAPRPLTVPLHLLTYVLAAAFVWRNRRVPGLPLLAVGAASNAVTIALNGGTLPASRSALEHAGRATETTGYTNSGVLEDPRLLWLGDVFSVPAWVPYANVFSIGDVVILLGAAWAVYGTCCVRPVPPVVVVPDALTALTPDELRREIAAARRALAQAQERQTELQRVRAQLQARTPRVPAQPAPERIAV